MQNGLTILAIDDEPLVLEGLNALLKKEVNTVFFYKANEFSKAKDIIENHHIDLILLDLDFRNSSIDGFSIAHFMRQNYPKIKIIVLTVNVKIDYITRLFSEGLVNGYLDKKLDFQILNLAITKVMAGERYLSLELEEALERGRWYTLTERGREVVELLSKGLAKKQIANKLFISSHTVDSHVRKLFKEFEVHTTQELVAKYVLYVNASSENQENISPFKKRNF